MRGFFRGRHEGRDLEGELRAARPEPRREFVNALEARVRQDGKRARGGFRVAFVGALTACMLFALASVGGLGYAASAAGEKPFEFLSTHPADSTRLARLKEHLPQAQAEYQQAKPRQP